MTDHPPAPSPGACPCCGEPSGKLFAMGHDARFRSRLAAALAAGGWDGGKVDWHAPDLTLQVTVREAVARVRRVIGRDWTDKLEVQASNVRVPPSPAGQTPAFTPRNLAAERVDALLDRLAGVALTGQWGWWRPRENLSPRIAGTDGQTRFPARVQKTHRDVGDSLVDLFCPDAFRVGVTHSVVVTGVDPATWIHDDDARTG